MKAAKQQSLSDLIGAQAPAEAPKAEQKPDDYVPPEESQRRAPPKPEYKHVPPTENPRKSVIESIAERAALETGNADAVPFDERSHLERAEGEEPAAPVLVSPGEPIPGDLSPADDPAIAPAAETPAAPAAEAAQPRKFKVEVKGQVAEVDEQAVIEAGLHALRHKGAAERALQEASALLQQARQYAPGAQPNEDPQAPASTPEDALKLAEAIQFGTKEDAAKAVAALMQRGVGTQDIGELVARTVETRIRDTLDQTAAAKQLEEMVPELKTDPYVLRLLATEERAARAAGDARPYTQLYPEIGQKVRGWLDKLKAPAAPASAPAPAAPIAARQAAKAAAPSAVPGRGAAPAAPATPKTPTGSEIIAQMRAARGQGLRI